MKDFERIREARKDTTIYLVHLVRHRPGPEHASSYEVLKEILTCGYFKAGFGQRMSAIRQRLMITIKGPSPAVCFTEQPLNYILTSNRILGLSRYPLYGVAVQKEHLYGYGGRPVIYGDESLLGAKVPTGEPRYEEDKEIHTGGPLHPGLHYLWVKYDPRIEPAFGGYPIDWTHEREWRCKPRRRFYVVANRVELWDKEDGVPILLPGDDEEEPAFRILVSKDEEVLDLRSFIDEELPTESTEGRILTHYLQKLRKARIISFEEVRRQLAGGDESWARIEDLPTE